MAEFDPDKLKALLDSLRPQPANVDFPSPQLPQGPDPELLRSTLDRANRLGMVHGIFGVRTPSTYEVMKTGSAQPQLMPSPAYDAAKANIMAPLQSEQARVDLANKQGGVQNQYAQQKAKFGLQAHQQENAAGLAEMKALLMGAMLGPKLQNAQDVAGINAKGRVDAASIGAKTRLEGPPISDAALDQGADVYSKTGQVPNIGNSGTKAKVANRAAARTPSADITTNKAANKADSASLSNQQKILDTAEGWERTGKANLDVLLGVGKRLKDTGSPWLNRSVRLFAEKGEGEPDQTAFKAAHATVVNEYAKILSGAQGSVGVTDSARHEAESMLPMDATWGQLSAAAKVLDTDASNRIAAARQQVSQIRGRISGQPPAGDKKITGYQRNKTTGQRRPVYSDGTYGQPE